MSAFDPLASVPAEGIIDCHGHLGHWHNFLVPMPEGDQMLAMMDRCRIREVWISAHLSIGPDAPAGNRLVAELARAHPGRIRGYAVVNPNYPAIAVSEMERAFDELGLEALKIHPSTHDYPVNGPHYRPVFEFAARRGTFVLTHTWGGTRTCSPSMLREVCLDFPEVPIIVGHSGGPEEGLQEALDLAEEFPNAHLDLTGCSHEWGRVERMVARIGDERILFGSDLPFLDPRPAIGVVAGSKLSAGSKQRIFRDNMAAIVAGIRSSKGTA